jgi:ABC-type polysaccharide/polyol phosphate transport system ATPase subunit
MSSAIEATNVTKIYRRFAHRRQFATLKSALLRGTLLRDLRPDETFPAVRGVSFAVPKGSTYGIIGRNGSGKSTMLKMVAGITKPSEGTVTVDGRISALIELGAGFHPEISGRENVFINGIMLGLTKKEVARRFDEIVDFAELRDFIDAPVKTYSSGMYMRLGFAVAINVDPDVLLIDEVLAVGDEAFTHKCLDKFAEFRRRNKTILLVTHSLNLVEKFCDNVLWLDSGRIRGEGDPRRVVSAYITDVAKTEQQDLAASDARARQRAEHASPTTAAEAHAAGPAGPASGGTVGQASSGTVGPASRGTVGPASRLPDEPPADMFKSNEGRWGSREVEIAQVQLLDASEVPKQVFWSGEPVTVEMVVRAHEPAEHVVFGVGIFNADGACCYGTNTDIEELEPARFSGEQRLRFRIESLDMVEGTYKLDVAAHRVDGYPYDYHRLLYSFRVKSRTKDVGIYRPAHTWEFSAGIGTKDHKGEA